VWQVWGRGEAHTEFRAGNVKGKDRLEDLSVDGKITLKLIFKKWKWRAVTGLIWLRVRTGGGFCEDCNEPSGYVICGEFLDYVRR
jgi:hypothetical protein